MFIYELYFMSFIIVIILYWCYCVFHFVLLPIIKPLQVVSNRITRKLHLYDLRYRWNLSWELKKKYPVIIQYNPPKWISAAEAGLLLHCYASSTDVVSLLYKWQAESLINILVKTWKNEKEIVVINKIEKIPDNYPKYEISFFNNLFRSGKTIGIDHFSDLSSSFNLELLENYWVKKWWFNKSSVNWDIKIKTYKMFLFVVIMTLLFIWFSVVSFKFWKLFFYHSWIEDVFPIVWFITFVVWVSVIRNSHVRLKRTEKWSKLVSEILWYRMFVQSCDEKQLDSFFKKDPLFFGEIVSYAVVFWLETSLLRNIIPILDKNIDPLDGYYWDWESLSKFSGFL